ncbi:diacylglycerol O-acyltransferase 1 isoform X2 [Cimex lectularius]|uniref:O-acyltransferase n=1 Tax=Cimex lectularius TaxID=79782 RepID=A0A8I6S0N9_CIMLE|nr:diacylglycerol O-acyltransferase 1 isoform X2 [Cimex lectularius]
MSVDSEGLRLRRTKSVTRAEEIQTQEARARRAQPDKPCHKPRDSLFSWSSGFTNFTGLVNWAFLLLSMGGLRLLLENLIKYGIRVDPEQWLIVLTGSDEGGPEHASLYLLAYSIVPIIFALFIEKGLAEGILHAKVGMPSHIVNLSILVMLPMIIIYIKSAEFSLMGASTVTFLYSVLFLKLWSYVQVNLWCRHARPLSNSSHIRRQSITLATLALDGDKVGNNNVPKENENIVKYPDNLTLKDLLYFIFAPTLCYELNFPKTDRIRKRFLLKRLLEVVILLQLILCLFQQWIIPSVKNSLIPFSNMDVVKATERLLKLAIPNHLVWLTFFYLSFHSFLNLMGELLHFADRNFYCDWWNSNNIDVFWRSWNMPVHRWAVRHLYVPLVEQGYSKTLASTAVFFISAFFHEYLVSVPLRTFKIWAFTGMMGQIPLSMFCHWVEKNFGCRWSNMIVWASLILGQPLCIMMYYHDYVITHFGESLIDRYAEV